MRDNEIVKHTEKRLKQVKKSHLQATVRGTAVMELDLRLEITTRGKSFTSCSRSTQTSVLYGTVNSAPAPVGGGQGGLAPSE